MLSFWALSLNGRDGVAFSRIDRANALLQEGHGDPRQRRDFHWPGEARELLTVTFTAVNGGTALLFGQTGGNLSPGQCEGTTAGWQLDFAAQDSLLEVKARSRQPKAGKEFRRNRWPTIRTSSEVPPRVYQGKLLVLIRKLQLYDGDQGPHVTRIYCWKKRGRP